MVRLVRGDAVYDIWIADRTDGVWLRASENGGPVRELRSAPRDWVERGLHDEMFSRLRDGWRRVRDPAREIDVDDEPREPRLEAALAADPDDAAAALVYADWYQQQEHPRGDLIAVQHALAARPGDTELCAREAALLHEWRDYLLGPLGEHYPNRYYGHLELALSWQHGFVRGARLEGSASPSAGVQLMWELLRHPSARFLRELVVAAEQPFGEGALLFEMLLRAGPTPPLRAFQVVRDGLFGAFGDLRELGARYPRLEDVVLTGFGDARLDGLHLPRARRFAFRTLSMHAATAAAIAGADLPSLVELELWFGAEEHLCDCTADDLALLWAGRFPALRVLRLMNSEFSNELAAAVARAPIAATLAVLDLSCGTLTDAGAATLADARPAFARLEALHADECCLTAAGVQRLQRAGLPLVARPGGTGILESQKSERYISASE